MSEQELSNQVKDLTLHYLERIGAEINEADGLYTIEIPPQFERIFGGIRKRITFDLSIADTHSCEFVVLGSNFLAIILGEIKKQAPVVGGHLKKQGDFPVDLLDSIKVHNGTIKLVDSSEDVKIALRFYFNINLKSVKNISMLRWVDVDFDTFEKLDFAKDLEMESSLDKIYEKNDTKIDSSYHKAIEIIQEEMTPLVDKYASLTKNSLQQDLDSLELSHKKRINEIDQDISYHKSKLREFDRKISHARSYSTKQKYLDQKRKQQQRILKEEQTSLKQMGRLTHDKELQKEQIEKRYRPVMDFALIASQIFSYSTTKCTLEIKNQYTRNKTVGRFLEYSKEFVVMCKNCKINSEIIHLCINGHVGCNLCTEQCVTCKKDVCQKCSHQLNPCYICKEGTCNDCSSNCKLCNEKTCSEHLIQCPHCSESLCYFCSDTCEICLKRVCIMSIHACFMCKKRVCEGDSQICMDCKQHVCPADRGTCVICNQIHCKNDSSKCKNCDQVYSKGCVKGNQCDTCSALTSIDSNSTQVSEIIQMDTGLEKYKKWEHASNSKFSVFRAKKTFGKKIIVFDKEQGKIIINKKGGWL